MIRRGWALLLRPERPERPEVLERPERPGRRGGPGQPDSQADWGDAITTEHPPATGEAWSCDDARPADDPPRADDARPPDDPPRADDARPADDACAAIVLVPAGRAAVAGPAVAAALPRVRGAVPVLATWNPDARDRSGTEEATSTGAARRARDRAAGCGVRAEAVGRTVHVGLPVDDVEAVAAVERLEATPGLAPVVLVVSGAWGAPFLGPIERAGVVHADGPAATVAACGRTLARHGVRVEPVPRPTGPVARALLRAGWLGRSSVRVPRPPADEGAGPGARAGEAGQALMMILLGLTVAAMLAVVLGGVASAMGQREERQRAVDVAALAAADRMRVDWPARAGSPAGLTLDRYRDRATQAARRAARANGLEVVEVGFPGPGAGDAGPLTVRVEAEGTVQVAGVALGTGVSATAELSPPAMPVDVATGDEYRGPLATRDGKPMRPDVAIAYDRMDHAATRAGHPLTVNSGYRSNAEQARLFAEHPDPKWVARPGTSLHRMGTELDLGPPSAYGWLATNATRFGFKQRYSWEAWHYGFTRDPGSSHVTDQDRNPAAPPQSGALPPWVPERYRDTIRAASIRFKISAALLAAQLKQESGFDPGARSPAGAQGIAQFMPATARAVGLADPFDPAQAIPAQAKLMAAHLRQFGSVQLALAAYNAGPGAVGACGCVPPYPETRGYVATIIALMKGYDPTGDLADALAIRLVA